MRLEHEDSWGEKFEETVSAAIISCFESEVKKNRGALPADRLNEEHLNRIREYGPYIPSSSRCVMAPSEDGKTSYFDIGNDSLPEHGCFSFPAKESPKRPYKDSYLITFLIRQVTSLGKSWHRRGPGQLYEMVDSNALDSGGIIGDRSFFSVSKEGIIHPAESRVANVRGYQPGKPVKIMTESEDWFINSAAAASFTLQFIADKRFCWTITAKENFAKVHLGCMREEIKSLLYARSLPITATGRKRPILHLVEAHQRRMRNGTEVDITSFLRGTGEVEIAGTQFKVNPPPTIKSTLSANSRRYF